MRWIELERWNGQRQEGCRLCERTDGLARRQGAHRQRRKWISESSRAQLSARLRSRSCWRWSRANGDPPSYVTPAAASSPHVALCRPFPKKAILDSSNVSTFGHICREMYVVSFDGCRPVLWMSCLGQGQSLAARHHVANASGIFATTSLFTAAMYRHRAPRAWLPLLYPPPSPT
jgi:hypothetical protein